VTIFLDIDGVMVIATGWKVPELLSDGFPVFSNRAVIALNKILSRTNASLVLTTSHKSRYSVDVWKHIFATRGIHAKISRLENSVGYKNRKEEVLNWLQTHPQEKRFVIIDDDKSLNDLPPQLKSTLVLTSPYVGLNEPAADQAINILCKSA
jgi:hypothetical protein